MFQSNQIQSTQVRKVEINEHSQQQYNYMGNLKTTISRKKHTTTLQSPRLAKTTKSGKTHNNITITQVSENNKICKNTQQHYNHLGQRKQQNLEKHTTTLQSPRLAKTTKSVKTHNNITITQVSENNKIWKNTQQQQDKANVSNVKQQYPETQK